MLFFVTWYNQEWLSLKPVSTLDYDKKRDISCVKEGKTYLACTDAEFFLSHVAADVLL